MSARLEAWVESTKFWVDVPDTAWRFHVRRPPPDRFARLVTRDPEALLRDYVIGWQGVQARDVAGESADPEPFDAELCAAWLPHQLVAYARVLEAIDEAVARQARVVSDLGKR